MPRAHREGGTPSVANDALMEAAVAQACLKRGHRGQSRIDEGDAGEQCRLESARPALPAGPTEATESLLVPLRRGSPGWVLAGRTSGCFLAALTGKLAVRSSPRRITAGQTSTVSTSRS